MPENAMFYLDIRNGKAYFRGDIYAEDGYFRGEVHATGGEFTGIVKATDFLTQDGQSMLTNGKFNSRYLDLGNIQIDGDTGDITMTVDINIGSASRIDLGSIVIDGANRTIRFTGGAGSILWGDSAPVKYQFATVTTGPWHDGMGTEDRYRRDSLDGGVTWGEPYQFRGTDGKNGRPGSDANIPDWVEAYTRTATYIDDQWVIAPNIAGGSITALDHMEAACDFYVGDHIYLGTPCPAEKV